jgi:hypothetical protein
VAIIRTNPHVLDTYDFFNSGSLTEAIVWAWGCMTTAISFPGHIAPTWLKLIHASILATGVFQLTFLLVCFSIMINAETTRTVTQATTMIRGAREKLEHTRALETSIIEGQATVVVDGNTNIVEAQVVTAEETRVSSPSGEPSVPTKPDTETGA